MADNIAIKIAIDTADANKSIKEIKQSLAALKDVKAGDINFDDAQKAVAKYKDSLDDLNDTTKALKGSGIEKLNSSLGLLKEGFVNADPGKLGAGFSVLGTAMKAVPIFLIIEGIKYLIDNFEDLKNSTGLVGDVFTAIGDVIGTVIQALKDLTDWLGISSFAAEEAAEKQINAAKATQDAITKKYDAEIRLAKAAGKDVAEIEIKKQQAIIDSAKVQFEIIKALAVANGEVSEEQKKQIIELGTAIGNAQLEINVIRVEENKKANDKVEESNKNHLQILNKAKEDFNKEQKRLADAALAQQKANDAAELASSMDIIAQVKKLKEDEELRIAASEEEKLTILKERELAALQAEYDKSNQSVETYQALQDAKLLIDQKYNDDLNTIRADADAKKDASAVKDTEMQQVTASENLQLAKVSNDSMIALSDLYFAVKAANTRKGSAEEMKAARQQFKINKALAITSAVISGIQGVVNALSAQSVIPEPFGTILKVATAVGVGIAAAANVAKIASTQFNPSGGGGASVAPATPAAPATGSFQAQGLQPIGGATQTAPTTAPTTPAIQPQKVYVVASDITGQQDKDQILERRASFNK